MLLAFGHKKGSGKDTAGTYLSERYSFERFAFAGRLKQMLQVLGVPVEVINGVEDVKEQPVPVLGFSYRQAAEEIGEAVRGLNPNAWVSLLQSQIEQSVSPNKVVTDLRFPNEAVMLKSKGFVLVSVDRKTKYSSTSSSEISLDGFQGYDFVLENNGTKEDFLAKVENLYQYLKEK